MQVAKNKVVAIDYRLTDDDGEVLDTSEGNGPLHYLHGIGNIIPGLESELEGKSVGDKFEISVSPEDAYGERDADLIQTVPKDSFEASEELELGMQFELPDEEGGLLFSIAEIKDDVVVIDANHELAGLNLNFDITVREIRDATPEELEHQHAHWPGDEHHDHE